MRLPEIINNHTNKLVKAMAMYVLSLVTNEAHYIVITTVNSKKAVYLNEIKTVEEIDRFLFAIQESIDNANETIMFEILNDELSVIYSIEICQDCLKGMISGYYNEFYALPDKELVKATRDKLEAMATDITDGMNKEKLHATLIADMHDQNNQKNGIKFEIEYENPDSFKYSYDTLLAGIYWCFVADAETEVLNLNNFSISFTLEKENKKLDSGLFDFKLKYSEIELENKMYIPLYIQMNILTSFDRFVAENVSSEDIVKGTHYKWNIRFLSDDNQVLKQVMVLEGDADELTNMVYSEEKRQQLIKSVTDVLFQKEHLGLENEGYFNIYIPKKNSEEPDKNVTIPLYIN